MCCQNREGGGGYFLVRQLTRVMGVNSELNMYVPTSLCTYLTINVFLVMTALHLNVHTYIQMGETKTHTTDDVTLVPILCRACKGLDL